MEFFTDTEQIRNFVNIDQSVSFESISTYFKEAETEYLEKYATPELVELVKSNLGVGAPDVALQKLEPFMRRVVAHFTIILAFPDFDVRFQEMGMTTSQNGNNLPASAARVDRFVDNRHKMGYMAVENMLRFLEKNKDDYQVWADSNCCTIFNGTLIKTADEFDKLSSINGSRVVFFDNRTTMEDAENLKVASDITAEYMAALIERQNNETLTTADKLVLPLIKRSIANFTQFSIHPEMLKYESNAMLYLGKAKEMLWANPDAYPEFKASPAYFDRTNFKRFENNSEQAIFVAGVGG